MFAIGGSIAIAEPADQPTLLNAPQAAVNQAPEQMPTQTPAAVSPPIALRWDDNGSLPAATSSSLEPPLQQGSVNKLIFPPEPTTTDNLQKLLYDMSPATFGRGGQDVLDPSYRNAVKMEPSDFCTNFSPYELGIVDTIAQILLPSAINSDRHRAVRAELYKLNVSACTQKPFSAGPYDATAYKYALDANFERIAEFPTQTFRFIRARRENSARMWTLREASASSVPSWCVCPPSTKAGSL